MFDFFLPTRIVFGSGRLGELGRSACDLGDRAVIVCGASASRNGVLDRAVASLREAGIESVVAPPTRSDPVASEVDEVIHRARDFGAAMVIGLGGGSAMDVAKAAGAAMGRGPVAPLVGQTLDRSPQALPVVAVPTTAGTGAEVTRGAIITDPDRGLKSGIRGDDVQPRLAICDPDLLQTLPSEVVADTVFDTFTHLVETAVVRKATPISRALSAAGLSCLHCAMAGPLDLTEPTVRKELSFAALLGGINISTVSSALPHRIQQAMGSLDAVACSHGRGLSLIYRAWLAKIRSATANEFDWVSRAFGVGDVAMACEMLQERLALPTRLRSAGYSAEHLPAILSKVTGNVENDPIPGAGLATIQAILEDSL